MVAAHRPTAPSIDVAFTYAGNGWPVFPCHTTRAGACSCGIANCSSPGKHPRVARGLHAASTAVGEVAAWWQRWPTANIGLRTGAESGLVVLDVDPAHGGSRSIKSLIDRHGSLSDVPRLRTGTGGWHLFFAHPGEPVRNSAGRLGAGLDIRGDGGYVIAPPSIHASGYRYRWEIDADELPPMPDWLHEPLAERVTTDRPLHSANSVVHRSSWAQAAFDAEIGRVRAAPEGSRNTTLNLSAFRLGQLVNSALLDEGIVERALVVGGINTGLSEREVIMTVRSGMRAGAAHPRSPAADDRGRPPPWGEREEHDACTGVEL